jgi:predicted RNA-binding protein
MLIIPFISIYHTWERNGTSRGEIERIRLTQRRRREEANLQEKKELAHKKIKFRKIVTDEVTALLAYFGVSFVRAWLVR